MERNELNRIISNFSAASNILLMPSFVIDICIDNLAVFRYFIIMKKCDQS